MRLLLKTLLDIGLKRILKRLRFDIQKKIDQIIPQDILINFVYKFDKLPRWANILEDLHIHYLENPSKLINKNEGISFKFLNSEEKMFFPIEWNNPNKSKLWKFNLHYFDWAREWLDFAINNRYWPNEASNFDDLLQDWFLHNRIGRGIGWDSYVLSIRCRNLIILFRCCPYIARESHIQSLWIQLNWLRSHKEECHGGNHLLENLITLAIGGLQFEGESAKDMYKSAIKDLQNELSEQILEDGGHFERSAAYHLLLLDRLTELGFFLEAVLGIRPKWLIKVISMMLKWSYKIRLYDGGFPIFNDSPIDICRSLDVVSSYASSYLFKTKSSQKGSYLILSNMVEKDFSNSKLESFYRNKDQIVDLKDTGWHIVRPGLGFEVTFKCGFSCPNYLPAHAQSDLLSFNVYQYGVPILIEAGTSIYSNGAEREYERSSMAHNSLQLGLAKSNRDLSSTSWIEPVEIWSSFRAARKAKIKKRYFRNLSNNCLLIGGSHDGFDRFGATHTREIKVCLESENNLKLKLTDYMYSKKRMFWRQWLHFSPNTHESMILSIIQQLKSKPLIKTEIVNTWMANGFGNRIPRKTVLIYGELKKSSTEFSVEIQCQGLR